MCEERSGQGHWGSGRRERRDARGGGAGWNETKNLSVRTLCFWSLRGYRVGPQSPGWGAGLPRRVCSPRVVGEGLTPRPRLRAPRAESSSGPAAGVQWAAWPPARSPRDRKPSGWTGQRAQLRRGHPLKVFLCSECGMHPSPTPLHLLRPKPQSDQNPHLSLFAKGLPTHRENITSLYYSH